MKIHHIKRHTLKQNGFGMIELLFSMLVFMVGILGAYNMQGKAMKGTMDSFQRSQALWMATDLAERLKTNPEGMNSGAYSSLTGRINVTGPQIFCQPSVTQCVGSSSCTAAQMVAYDMDTAVCQKVRNNGIILKGLSITCWAN